MHFSETERQDESNDDFGAGKNKILIKLRKTDFNLFNKKKIKKLVSMTCQQARNILAAFSIPEDKLQALQYIKR